MRGLLGRSPKVTARVAGAFYLALTGTALFAEFFVRSRLIVRGNIVETARNIIMSDRLYRIGIVSDILTLLFDTAVAVLLYYLLRPVSHILAVFAAVLRLIMVCILSAAVILALAPLKLLDPTISSSSPMVAQLQALASISLDLRGQTTNVALVFFGAHLVLVSVLVIRSTFMPRTIGILLGLAGLGYILNSLIRFAAPGLIEPFFPYFAGLWAIAEWSFTLWLLAVGVNNENWLASARKSHLDGLLEAQ